MNTIFVTIWKFQFLLQCPSSYFNSLTHCFSILDLENFQYFENFKIVSYTQLSDTWTQQEISFQHDFSWRLKLAMWLEKLRTFSPVMLTIFWLTWFQLTTDILPYKISQPWWRFNLGLGIYQNFKIFKFSNFNTTSKFIFFNSVKYFLSIGTIPNVKIDWYDMEYHFITLIILKIETIWRKIA